MLDELSKILDFREFASRSQSILISLAKNKELILHQLDEVLLNPILIEKSECYDFLDKIVICCDERTGTSIRISQFNERYANRLHCHRWDYSAIVLHGQYVQHFYGIEPSDGDITPLRSGVPVFTATFKKGSCYSLHNSVVHSVEAKPGTISLCIRGPAVKDRFMTLDPRTGNSWWQYGSKSEAAEERNMKRYEKKDLALRIKEIQHILMEEM